MTPDDFDPFAAMDPCCGRLIITADDMRHAVGDTMGHQVSPQLHL
jgi:hypothetical protein